MYRIRRLACILGALAASVLALGSAPALATLAPPPGMGSNSPSLPGQGVTTHLVTVGGMPGWQIALIAAAAALAGALLAVIADRARATRRQVRSSTT